MISFFAAEDKNFCVGTAFSLGRFYSGTLYVSFLFSLLEKIYSIADEKRELIC